MDELFLRRHVVKSEFALGWVRVFREPAGTGAETHQPGVNPNVGL